MTKTPEGYRLSSGRDLETNGGFISMTRTDDGQFQIATGYDDLLWTDGRVYESAPWTPAERRELADFMIAQWTAYKDSIGSTR